MSLDGYLPDNVSDADFDAAYPPDCPVTCASMRECPSDCGGCACHIHPPCPHCEYHEKGECDCPSESELKAERAEMKAEARGDR